MRNRAGSLLKIFSGVGVFIVFLAVGSHFVGRNSASRDAARWAMNPTQTGLLTANGISSATDPRAVALALQHNKILPTGEGRNGLSRQDAMTQDLFGYLKKNLENEGQQPTDQKIREMAVNIIAQLLAGVRPTPESPLFTLPTGTFVQELEDQARASLQAYEPAQRELLKEKSKRATVVYWQRFFDIGSRQYANLGKSPTRKQVNDSYQNASDQIYALPVSDVDQDLVVVCSKFAQDFSDLAHVGRDAEATESAEYQISKVFESAARGLVGDIGTLKEVADESNAFTAECRKIKSRLRGDMFDLNILRAKLTAKYGVEFNNGWAE